LPFLLVLVPGPLQYSDDLWQKSLEYCRFDGQDFERDKPNRILVDWCEKQHIQVLDLLPAFTAATREQPLQRLFLDVHLSPAGHRLAAATIAAVAYPLR
jgi:lysophospholipase L1-like esterase